MPRLFSIYASAMTVRPWTKMGKAPGSGQPMKRSGNASATAM